MTEGRGHSPEDYYRAVITDAAKRLRAEHLTPMLALIACDLEDSLSWSADPEKCAHPYWRCDEDGQTVCRSCGADTSDMEGMGT